MQNERVEQQWRELSEQGAWVFPLPAGGKNPGDLGIRWKNTWIERGRNPWPQLAAAHFDAEGLWLATGQISKRVALDIDRPEAGAYWRDKIGPDLYDRALKARTRKGHHVHFRIPADDDRPWPGHSDNELGYDFRADGGGVVLPPSVHESGHVYEWVDGELFDVPECLRHPRPSKAGSNTEGNVKSLDRARERRTPGSTLAGLLADPPEEGGRNNWLTKVCGHLAKLWPGPMEDAYGQLALFVGQNLPEPLEEDEIRKTAASVWDRERNHTGIEAFSDESGQLVGRDGKLYTKRKGEDGANYVTEWADFDVRARRVVQEKDERVFYIDVETAHTTYLNEPLRAEVLGSINRLNVWMAAHHCSIIGHPQDVCKMAYGTRIQRYLLAQDPAVARIADHYGHQPDGSFLTPDGLIEGGGVVPFRDLIPADHLSTWTRYRYGTCPPDEAVDVLREVLTFQHESVASVFGAWWCMAILKGRYQSSLFPFMMLEAVSGSGKTTGFFAQMVALAGSLKGAGQGSLPAFRDDVAAHRNGIAWLDDLNESEVNQAADIIRQATSEGSRSKKGSDSRITESITLLCPILLSGEGSGSMMSEKAMRDRAIKLTFDSPKDRPSLHDPDRLQWDDVLALTERYGSHPDGLSVLAGTLVAQVLSRDSLLSSLAALRPAGAGRHSDKMAILRMGARVLADVTGDGFHIDRVDAWVEGQVDTGAANLACNKIIPWSLMDAGGGVPRSANGWQSAFYDEEDGCVWVHPEQLSKRWLRQNHISDRERQLGTEDAIRAELRAVCGGNIKGSTRTTGPKEKKRYAQLPPGISAQIMKAVGEDLGE